MQMTIVFAQSYAYTEIMEKRKAGRPSIGDDLIKQMLSDGMKPLSIRQQTGFSLTKIYGVRRTMPDLPDCQTHQPDSKTPPRAATGKGSTTDTGNPVSATNNSLAQDLPAQGGANPCVNEENPSETS